MVGMDFILYAFFSDFTSVPLHDFRHVLAYLPFAVMAVAALLLHITACGMRLRPNLTDTSRSDIEQHHVVRSER
jgi:hypothetical protein